MNRQYAKAAGWAALVLTAGTGLTYAIRGVADLGFWVPLGLALAVALVWGLEYGREALATLGSRRSRQGANALVYTLAVLAIALLVQALVVNNDISTDLSKNKAFTLADETVKTLKGLDQKVMVYAFFGPENKGAMEDLLQRAKKVNPGRLDYEFVNLNRKPLLAQELGVRSLGTTVVQCGDKKETLNTSKEEDLLNALLKVSNGSKKQVYVLSGHQERSLEDAQTTGLSALRAGLESANFVVRSLNLGSAVKGAVPEDAAAVVLAGPRTDLMAPELDGLQRYLARGGRVYVALDPRVNTPGLKVWLSKAGAQLGEDIVIDVNPFNQIFGGSPVAPIIQTFDLQHPITRDMAQSQAQTIFPQTRTVSLGKLGEGVQGTVLARTLPTAFAWTGAGNNAPSKPGPSDKRGPLDLMVAIEGPVRAFGADLAAPAALRARLVVLGTSALLANSGVAAFNNQDMVVNGLRWLADDEKRIALAPKSKENSPLLLDRGRLSLVWWSVILLALAALGGGVIVSILRRRAA